MAMKRLDGLGAPAPGPPVEFLRDLIIFSTALLKRPVGQLERPFPFERESSVLPPEEGGGGACRVPRPDILQGHHEKRGRDLNG